MHLAVAATQFEMNAFLDMGSALPDGTVTLLVSGIGPVESGISTTQFLAAHHSKIDCVVNFGIGGAYSAGAPEPAGLLDICLADAEVLGDFGVCVGHEIKPFEGAGFTAPNRFEIDRLLLDTAQQALRDHHLDFRIGTFVTVNASSGSRARGDFLCTTFKALCENMEGAAIARACAAYELAFLEVRAMSNVVEDRPGSPWKTVEAAEQAAGAAARIIGKLLDTP
ncbi:MAG: futalosine hydrolase [Desulfofustis sp.]|nr:futalosine hydrolase [Desulfofustis sp.]